jgi:hypothetical protein
VGCTLVASLCVDPRPGPYIFRVCGHLAPFLRAASGGELERRPLPAARDSWIAVAWATKQANAMTAGPRD